MKSLFKRWFFFCLFRSFSVCLSLSLANDFCDFCNFQSSSFRCFLIFVLISHFVWNRCILSVCHLLSISLRLDVFRWYSCVFLRFSFVPSRCVFFFSILYDEHYFNESIEKSVHYFCGTVEQIFRLFIFDISQWSYCWDKCWICNTLCELVILLLYRNSPNRDNNYIHAMYFSRYLCWLLWIFNQTDETCARCCSSFVFRFSVAHLHLYPSVSFWNILFSWFFSYLSFINAFETFFDMCFCVAILNCLNSFVRSYQCLINVLHCRVQSSLILNYICLEMILFLISLFVLDVFIPNGES